jgi:hypothetical protein
MCKLIENNAERQEKEVKTMEKNTWALVALIGGILLVIGIFLPWVNALNPFNPTAPAVKESAWDAADVIAIASGFMVLLGAIAVWASNSLRSMVSVGAILGLAESVSVYKSALTTGTSYGIWIYMIGAVIALIAMIGILSMKK